MILAPAVFVLLYFTISVIDGAEAVMFKGLAATDENQYVEKAEVGIFKWSSSNVIWFITVVVLPDHTISLSILAPLSLGIVRVLEI